jgi:hypothetical protein
MDQLEDLAAQADEIIAGLSWGVCSVLISDRFKRGGWEPTAPFSPAVNRMVEQGLFRRADGRCGFEAFKDAFIVPTRLCLAVRERLLLPTPSQDKPHG